MNLEKTIPFTWKSWDKMDELSNIYYNVEFVEDFGVFEKSEVFRSINVDYALGLIEAYNQEGSEVIKKELYKASPIN